jgi:hypothetical protein
MIHPNVANGVLCILGVVCLCASGDEPEPTLVYDPAAIVEIVKGARQDLAPVKEKIIKETMLLSEAEATKFWPIYKAYEKESLAAADEAVGAVKRALEARQAGEFKDPAARQILDAYFEYEGKRLAILRKACEQVSTELSPLRAAQFVQIEHRVRIAIDTHLAAGMPLLKKAEE